MSVRARRLAAIAALLAGACASAWLTDTPPTLAAWADRRTETWREQAWRDAGLERVFSPGIVELAHPKPGTVYRAPGEPPRVVVLNDYDLSPFPLEAVGSLGRSADGALWVVIERPVVVRSLDAQRWHCPQPGQGILMPDPQPVAVLQELPPGVEDVAGVREIEVRTVRVREDRWWFPWERPGWDVSPP